MEAFRDVLTCSEEVACECREKVVEDVYNGCRELFGLDVAQACIQAADKQEVTQHIKSVASN